MNAKNRGRSEPDGTAGKLPSDIHASAGTPPEAPPETPPEAPPVPPRLLRIRSKMHLARLAARFHERNHNILQGMIWHQTGGRLHPEDQAECYVNGFTNFVAFLERKRKAREPLVLRGEDDDDSLLMIATVIFRCAVYNWLDAQRRRNGELSLSPDDDGSMLLEPMALELQPDEQAAQTEASEAVRRGLVTADLNEMERLVFQVYLEHADEFDNRSIFEPLSRFIHQDTNETLSVAEVERLWRAGRDRLRRQLCSLAGPVRSR